MSNRSSLCSESAASELDPHFRSLKEPVILNRSSFPPHLSNPPCSPCSSLDSPISIPPTVSFPLPPRRLRPGEIVGITDIETTVVSPTYRPASPTTPASLYGVAIGGHAPTKPNPTINGRAEVQTDGLTSLDLRKRTLRARMAESQPAQFRSSAETVNLRARNPSRMLAPPHFTLQSSSRYLKLQSSTPSHQNLTRHVSTLPRDPISMATSSLPRSGDLSRPPRNHSFLESTAKPIPRLPSTRLAYQSLSYHISSHELSHQTLSSIKQPLDEALSVHPPTSDLHALQFPSINTSHVSQNHIKFAPLPNKPPPPAYALGSSKSNLAESENVKSKQFSKKKPAWIGRWFSPNPNQASKFTMKTRPEISLPVQQTLVITGTRAATTNAMVPALSIKRRSSVNDQQSPKDVPLEPQRPRSRSYSSTRPTLGMVANMVQRSPSRSVEETLASGKTLLHGSQHIYSPTRTQSLRNLVVGNSSPTRTSNLEHDMRDSSESQSLSAEETCDQSLINSHSIQGTGALSFAAKPGDAQKTNAGAPPAPPTIIIDHHDQVNTSEISKQSTPVNVKPAERAVEIPEEKKKREIRFRNTLELIPDPVCEDSPQIVAPAPVEASSESLKPALKPSNTRRLVPPRNLNPFNHLRKPRYLELDGDDRHFSIAPFTSTQGPHQSDADTNLSPPNSSTEHNLRLPHHHDNPENNEIVDLCSRKLAPKVNLTFVDLDHHIGSRFSVNTLFREVQKSLPDVILNPDTQSGDSTGSDFDPIHQTERQLTSRKPPEPVSEDPSEGKDGSSSDSLGSPTTATSTSNPVDLKSSNPYLVHSGHNSVIEVVKTNGADVVFQMVVPVNSSGMKPTNERTTAGLAFKDGVYYPLKGNQPDNEDDLTVISERLVALNKSIQAQEARSSSSESNRQRHDSSNIPNNGVPQNLSTGKGKISRIENWLSNVPSPLTSPVNKVQSPSLNLQNSQHILKVEKDELETLEQVSEYPESPIDRHHIPPRPALKAS